MSPALIAIWFALGAIYGCIVGPMIRKALTEPCQDEPRRLANRDGRAPVSLRLHFSNDNDEGQAEHAS